jgi:hypothetical protein
MFRQTLLALAVLAIVGCEASTKLDPFANKSTEPAQLAAYAATAKYPTDAQPKDGPKVAVLDRDDSIRLINFGNEPVRNANIWVDGMFVHRIELLPAMGSVTLNKSVFYDGTGRALNKAQSTPMRVTLQEGDNNLFSTLGPVKDTER